MKSSTVVLIAILIGFLCFVMAACVLGVSLLLISNETGEVELEGAPQAGQLAPDIAMPLVDHVMNLSNERVKTPIGMELADNNILAGFDERFVRGKTKVDGRLMHPGRVSFCPIHERLIVVDAIDVPDEIVPGH